MNPLDIIFQAISNMTGGLVTDSMTLVIGMCTVGLICTGIDVLTEPLQARFKEWKFEREVEVGYDDYFKKRRKNDIWKARYEDWKRENT